MKNRDTEHLDELLTRTIEGKKSAFDFDTWRYEHAEEIAKFQRQQQHPVVRLANIRKQLMKSKITRYAAAAVILMAIAAGMYMLNGSLDGTSKVYAITDAPEIYKASRTIHMKARIYYPAAEPDAEPICVESEHWLDIEGKRWRSVTPCSSQDSEGLRVWFTEDVYNGGEVLLSLDHKNKIAEYHQLSDLQSELRIRGLLNSLLAMSLGDSYVFDHYQIVGRQEIDGYAYDIWEAQVQQALGGYAKLRTWLDPQTGLFHRAIVQMRNSPEDTWFTMADVYLVERDIPLDADNFSLSVPEGYSPANSPETAEPASFHRLMAVNGSLTLTCFNMYALMDGSVIVFWSSEDSEAENNLPISLDTLRPGDPFPALPVVVHGLQATSANNDAKYEGYYLGHTVSEGRAYLCGLYVRNQTAQPDKANQYELLCRTHVPDKTLTARLATAVEIVIESENDFEIFVCGTLRELGEGDPSLCELGYQDVLELADQIRGSK